MDGGLRAPAGKRLVPGVFNNARRYPFQSGSEVGLNVAGQGRQYEEVSGRFSIEELQWDPVRGLIRFSAIFVQFCDNGTPALGGVINYQASGTSDPTPTPNRTINLSGKVSRVAYDPTRNLSILRLFSTRPVA